MRADPYNIKKANSKAVLQAKVNKLKQLVLKTKLPGATQKLAQIEQLPVYSETEEVAKILKEMLSDLSTLRRLRPRQASVAATTREPAMRNSAQGHRSIPT